MIFNNPKSILGKTLLVFAFTFLFLFQGISYAQEGPISEDDEFIEFLKEYITVLDLAGISKIELKKNISSSEQGTVLCIWADETEVVCYSQENEGTAEPEGSSVSYATSTESAAVCGYNPISFEDIETVELEESTTTSVSSVSAVLQRVIAMVQAMEEKVDDEIDRIKKACAANQCAGHVTNRNIRVTVTPLNQSPGSCTQIGECRSHSFFKSATGPNCASAVSACANILAKSISGANHCNSDCSMEITSNSTGSSCNEPDTSSGGGSSSLPARQAVAFCFGNMEICCTDEASGWFSIDIEIKVEGDAGVMCIPTYRPVFTLPLYN